MENPSRLHFSIQQETAPESGMFTSRAVRIFTQKEGGDMQVTTATDLPFEALGSCVALVQAGGMNEEAIRRMKGFFEELARNPQLRTFTSPIKTIVELPPDTNIASASDPTIPTVDSLFPFVLQQQNATSDFDPRVAQFASQALLNRSPHQVTLRLASMGGKMLANTGISAHAPFDYALGTTADNRAIRISIQSSSSRPPDVPQLPRA